MQKKKHPTILSLWRTFDTQAQQQIVKKLPRNFSGLHLSTWQKLISAKDQVEVGTERGETLYPTVEPTYRSEVAKFSHLTIQAKKKSSKRPLSCDRNHTTTPSPPPPPTMPEVEADLVNRWEVKKKERERERERAVSPSSPTGLLNLEA